MSQKTTNTTNHSRTDTEPIDPNTELAGIDEQDIERAAQSIAEEYPDVEPTIAFKQRVCQIIREIQRDAPVFLEYARIEGEEPWIIEENDYHIVLAGDEIRTVIRKQHNNAAGHAALYAMDEAGKRLADDTQKEPLAYFVLPSLKEPFVVDRSWDTYDHCDDQYEYLIIRRNMETYEIPITHISHPAFKRYWDADIVYTHVGHIVIETETEDGTVLSLHEKSTDDGKLRFEGHRMNAPLSDVFDGKEHIIWERENDDDDE